MPRPPKRRVFRRRFRWGNCAAPLAPDHWGRRWPATPAKGCELSLPGLFAQLQPAENDVSPLVRAAVVRALAALPDTAADRLLPMLSDQDARVRREAVWGLGQSRFAGQPAVAGRLTQTLQQDADCRVRAEAAWALGELGDPSAIPALQAVSEQPCRMAAQAAVSALDRLR